MEANTNTVPEDIIQIQHQTASWQVCWWAQTRLRVETQLLSYDILNFCPTKASHILSGLENLPFPPSRHRGRETEKVKDRELSSSERVKYELQLLAHSCNKMSSPYGQSLWTCHIYLSTKWPYTLFACNPNFCQALPQTSSLHPVCQQVWVHTINLEWARGRRNSGREFVGGGKGGKVGQRTQTEAKAAAPSAPRSFSRILHSALAPSLLWGGDSWWGTFESAADCSTVLVLYAEMFLIIGLRSTLIGWVTKTQEVEMVLHMDCYSKICHPYLLTY